LHESDREAGLEEVGVRAHHVGEPVSASTLERADRHHVVALTTDVAKVCLAHRRLRLQAALRPGRRDPTRLRENLAPANQILLRQLPIVQLRVAQVGGNVRVEPEPRPSLRKASSRVEKFVFTRPPRTQATQEIGVGR
jgi:hypothetical protein